MLNVKVFGGLKIQLFIFCLQYQCWTSCRAAFIFPPKLAFPAKTCFSEFLTTTCTMARLTGHSYILKRTFWEINTARVSPNRLFTRLENLALFQKGFWRLNFYNYCTFMISSVLVCCEYLFVCTSQENEAKQYSYPMKPWAPPRMFLLTYKI